MVCLSCYINCTIYIRIPCSSIFPLTQTRILIRPHLPIPPIVYSHPRLRRPQNPPIAHPARSALSHLTLARLSQNTPPRAHPCSLPRQRRPAPPSAPFPSAQSLTPSLHRDARRITDPSFERAPKTDNAEVLRSMEKSRNFPMEKVGD